MFLTRIVEVNNVFDVFNEENSGFKNLIIIDLSNGINKSAYSEALIHTIKSVGNIDRDNLYAFVSDSSVSEKLWAMMNLLSPKEDAINSKGQDIISLVSFESIRSCNSSLYVFFCSLSDDEVMKNLSEIQIKIKRQENFDDMKSLTLKIIASGLPAIWDDFVSLMADKFSS